MAASLLLAAGSAPWAQPAARPEVDVQPLSALVIHPQREAAASVLARNESKVAVEVNGVLLRWTAEVGSNVDKGEVLAEIDPRDFRLALQRAQAALEGALARLKQAELQLARSRVLVAQGFFSREALLQRETELALMQSEVASNRAQSASAQHQLAKTTVRAPFAAGVKQRLAQAGEVVAPGTVLYVLTENGSAEVGAHLPPADVAGLRHAHEVFFATQGQSYPLRLLRVVATVSAPARTQEVRLAFARGSAPPVPPGSDGRLLWREAHPHLPAALLVRRGNALGVFIEQGGHARFVALPGAQEGRAVPLALPLDTRLVVRGQATLQDGALIK